jgi:hypothetical protein
LRPKWEILGGGFPLEPVQAEMRGMGLTPVLPPSVGASRMDALRTLWTGAGFTAVETREISVQRTFANFDDFWTIILLSPSLRPMIAAMSSEDAARLRARVQARLLPDASLMLHAPTRLRVAYLGEWPSRTAFRIRR